MVLRYYHNMNPPPTETTGDLIATWKVPVIAEHIGVRPGYCGGEPHILGHRVKVRHVAVWHEQGDMSPAEIVATYPTLTLAQVHSALAYYYDHRAEIQVAIAEQDRFVEDIKTKAGSSLLQEKMMQGNATDNSVPS
jgi:uncharacterized protein (DUF433 family)